MQQRILWKKQKATDVMLVGKVLFVWGTLICLIIGSILQIIGYDFMDNKPLFVLGTVFIGLGAMFIAVDLVKCLRNFRKKRKTSERRRS